MANRLLAACVMVVLTACGVNEAQVSGGAKDVTSSQSGLTWEAFLARTYQEPGTGVYIADGDTVFQNVKQLREFYEMNVREGQLIVNRVGSADDVWDATRKLNLTYCVSNSFGSHKAAVVQAMAAATGAWAAAANVKYVYVSAQDGSCTAANANVLFDVNPVNVNGNYLARAFFPSNPRSGRNVLIDNTAFSQVGDPSLTGILRHELGHTLGFRHEHTRPESGTCFEDNNWRALTQYDQASVMHYPQCNGSSSWALDLTSFDITGAQALYGAPGGTTGGTPTPTPTPTPAPAGSTVETFSGSLAVNQAANVGPFAVVPGTQLTVTMTGTGDADLYVRFGAAPTASSYDCRPYLDGSAEECVLTVPATASSASVMVFGYKASTYALKVTYTKGAAAPAPTGGTAKTATVTGSVAQGALQRYAPITVKPGSTFTVTMSGTGDPDLYVRFGADPTMTLFDCRPYLNGANEKCSVTVPGNMGDARIMISGYSAATYTLQLAYTAP